MKISCPKCNTILGATDLNVATDVAVCPNCNELFSLSTIASTGHEVDEAFDIHNPPKGVSFHDDGTLWRISASTRSPTAFFLIPFMCVWSGFSLGGIYGSQFAKGEFDLASSLFGIPFLLGTLLFGSIAVMSVCGQLVVTMDRFDGRVFVGVGPLGWTRRFDWSSITAIKEESVGSRTSENNMFAISLVGQTGLKFGSMLTEARRKYILQALRMLLAKHRK